MKYLNKFSKSKIDEIVNEDDLNEAMCLAQDNIGVKSGDVCGVYFSKFTDADEEWEQASSKERTNMLKEYLSLEDSYSGLGEEDVWWSSEKKMSGGGWIDEKLVIAHEKEVKRKKARITNLGWNSGEDYIGSKTTKGILFSEVENGKIIHDWEEDENKMSGGGDVYDDFDSTIIEINRTAKMLFNRLRGPLKLSDKDYTPGNYNLDAEIKIATKKFINVGPDGAYITEIHSNGTMSFSEPTSDLQKVISEVLRKKMSGGGSVPKGVMTLKEWVENTDLDEVGKYVKSKLKKPETQIYVIGEEDDYAVTIDTDWKEDKPLTDEEGSEHTLYIGKGVVEIDTDGAFTNTFFTKDANSTITKKYDEMSGGGGINNYSVDDINDGFNMLGKDGEYHELKHSKGIKNETELVKFISESNSAIESIYIDGHSGAWEISLANFPNLGIYATPFYEDIQGTPVEISPLTYDDNPEFMVVEATKSEIDKIKTYLDLANYYKKSVVPELVKFAKKHNKMSGGGKMKN